MPYINDVPYRGGGGVLVRNGMKWDGGGGTSVGIWGGGVDEEGMSQGGGGCKRGNYLGCVGYRRRGGGGQK